MAAEMRASSDQRRAWLMAIRPRTLPASIAPVIVGAGVALHAGVFRLPVVLVALFAALMIQIGSNLANDLGDYLRGTDVPERVGPTRVTTAGLLTPRQVKTGLAVALGLAALAGVYLILVGGWPILVAGVLSCAAAVAYTAGPLPFGYYGLGDLGTFVFFGLVAVVGTVYAQAQAITPLAVIAAVPMGTLVTAILVVNNVRDIDTDRRAGKRTLAVLLGRTGARAEYLVLLGVAFAVPVLLWLAFDCGPWVLLAWLALPLAVRQARAVLSITGPALNRTLAGTAQLAVVYAILFALGLAL